MAAFTAAACCEVRERKDRQILAGFKSRLPGFEPTGFAVALDRREIALGGLFHFIGGDPIFLKR